MTTLCYAKKTCSIGIHVLLEEIGTPYDLRIVDFSKGEQKTPEYKALNPKGKVAALVRQDGSVITEFAAIAMWLSMTNPDKKLMPTDPAPHAPRQHVAPPGRLFRRSCWAGVVAGARQGCNAGCA